MGQWHTSLVIKYVNARTGHLEVMSLSALNLSRFFLDWARPYGDEKQIIHDTVWTIHAFAQCSPPECVAEACISTTITDWHWHIYSMHLTNFHIDQFSDFDVPHTESHDQSVAASRPNGAARDRAA